MHTNLLFTLMALLLFRQKVSPCGTKLLTWKAGYSFVFLHPFWQLLSDSGQTGQGNKTIEDYSTDFRSKPLQEGHIKKSLNPTTTQLEKENTRFFTL